MILVSILGDSISTFEGYNPSGYSVYYDNYYDKKMQEHNGLTSVYDTWWAMVNQAIHAYLCVNNSYSGSEVTGDAFPAASSAERIFGLRTAEFSPDLILIYIGFNDFANGATIKRNRFPFFRKRDLSVFEDAYAYMIDQIKEQYPGAKVVCGTLLRTKIKGNREWNFPEIYRGVRFEDYNEVIRRLANKKQVFLADVASLNVRYETLDGTHPNMEGHRTIANAWIQCLMEFDLQWYA